MCKCTHTTVRGWGWGWGGSLEDVHTSLQKSIHVKFAQELVIEADEWFIK